MNCILTFDVGTTSVKTCLFDFALNLLCCINEEYALDTENGWVELDPETYIDAIKAAAKQALAAVPEAQVKAISAVTQGETLIPVTENGTPLRKAIVWLDARAEAEAAEISKDISTKTFARTTGLPELTGACPIAKLLWIKNNEPDVYCDCHQFLFLEDWIIFRLTGQFVTEKSLVSSSGYFSLETDEYWDEILNVAGIAKEKLPPAKECGTLCAAVSEKAAKEFGLPKDARVFTGAMDQVASVIGAGAMSEKIMTETTGTALVVTSFSKKRAYYAEKGVTEYRHAVKGTFLNLAFSNTAGIVLKWFKDTFCQDLASNGAGSVYEQLDQMAEKIAPLADGLLLFPHFEGMNLPKLDTNAKGVFFGVGLNTTREHFVRAILEGVSFMLRENMEAIDTGSKEVRSLGGASGSDVWCRIKADITNRNMITYDAESTSRGAAILAACGLGVYKNLVEAFDKIIPQKRYQPSENRAVYEAGYQRYCKMYTSFRTLF